MPTFTAADTIRILIATDSHVGYAENDAVRKDDSWRSFDEVMRLAKDRDVDMVLLAGDLFHYSQPSRKAMYQVMRSLRMNCLGEKPCELELLSDANDIFDGSFNHVNYEDPDINVAIPVFSIHGNHDDPAGDGNYCALDLLQASGLVNYFGRTPEADRIQIKPVLLQKGQTKLALYGMSNVRDERLYRTFRDGHVKWFKPGVQQKDWFNIMAVHQNHHAHTETSYLPENFLPDFLDLVVWGHEHECLIDPTYNPEKSFHVMQPGSSVATSLVPGEAVPKHVAIASITGREFKIEKIRLKSVRPFITKEVVLATDKRTKHLAKVKDNRTKLTKELMTIVDELIDQARAEWISLQDEPEEELDDIPLPLVRLKVEFTPPEGGKFDCENPQRFSSRFINRVANIKDVIQYHRKKAGATRKSATEIDLPEEGTLAQVAGFDDVKVELLVKEFLEKQSLQVLPTTPFGDAVGQFVDKDDRHAMEIFVQKSLKAQVEELIKQANGADNEVGDEDEYLNAAMEKFRAQQEALAARSGSKSKNPAKKLKPKPRPADFDSDLDGEWGEKVEHCETDNGENNDDDSDDAPPAPPPKRGNGTGNGKNTSGFIISDDDSDDPFAEVVGEEPKPTTTKKTPAKRAPAKKTAAPRKTPAKPTTTSRSRKKVPEPEPSDDEDEDVEMEEAPAPTPAAKPKSQPKRAAAARGRQTQTQLTFSQPSQVTGGGGGGRKKQVVELSDDEISEDDDDAFQPMSAVSSGRARRR
ncbi:putative double-strand break repair protein mus-23 protein [Botrytis fragariae]|uniref:Double-strand break repair protein n=1 Tax=Botrytis fragariae TaxID=1964551 RepID=A0A8H6EFT1_9HELO|nr:putative double-strand break repair protein mus-23 protein [Botrytis fragariae]KAF5870543.1 putative double-strand break repair protein mus-23 protein [Botrytis fragariae]